MEKATSWSGWIKPNISQPTSYHCIGFNFGDRFDGFHTWDVYEKGNKVNCIHESRESINPSLDTKQPDKD